VILLPLVLNPVASRGAGAAAVPFAPNDLAGLIEWYAADFGVLKDVGNYFTDATASIELAGFQIFPSNGVYLVTGVGNGKNSYYRGWSGGYNGNSQIYWDGSQWVKRDQEDFDEGDPFISFSYATGNTTYPWQATWSGGTLTRTATTIDIPAVEGQQVRRWVNKVSGQPHAEQRNLSSQPTFFVSGASGKPFLYFRNTPSIRLDISNFPAVNPPITYYAVLTNKNFLSQTIINRTNAATRWRSVLEIDQGAALMRRFSNSTFPSDGYANFAMGADNDKVILCGSLNGSNNGGFLRRVSASQDNGEGIAVIDTGINSSLTSSLGSRGWSVSGVNNGVDELYEFLRFNVVHEANERNLVINYLKNKHSL
jgi:hypothetical protein